MVNLLSDKTQVLEIVPDQDDFVTVMAPCGGGISLDDPFHEGAIDHLFDLFVFHLISLLSTEKGHLPARGR
jgi:hypothetical protein